MSQAIESSAWGLVLGLALALPGCGRSDALLLIDEAGSSSGPVDETNEGPGVCGNGVAEGSENCDGNDVRGETCQALGLGTGLLGCRPGCQVIDTAGCSDAPDCGNGQIDPGEACDSGALDGRTCATEGYERGVLACNASCTDVDVSGCTDSLCGNGMLDPGESCDEDDLGGATCERLTGEAGELRCEPGCQRFDLQGCGDYCADADLGSQVGPSVASGNTNVDDDDLPQGCASGGGADHVLRFVPPVPGLYTIETTGSSYDTALAVFASCHPGSQLACNDDDGGSLQSRVDVELGADQPVFVSVDGFGGETGGWVLGITAPTIPSAPGCTEQDLMWTVGSPAAAGNTAGEDIDFAQTCAAGGGPDRVLRFIAPWTGRFSFDTVGSDYDTALSLHNSCGPGQELACNDDVDGVQSQIEFDLSAGQQILVVVSGFDGATGTWVLNITAA